MIRGGVTTLREMKSLSPDERAQLLEMIDVAARRLEETALDPQPATPEERELRPTPDVHAT